jgi:A/G-specific adenine glycosylase
MGIFSNTLLKWFEIEKRDLPWKLTNDPYKIWISEIVLQQTRVDQGTSYYLKFIKKFPTIQSLANAQEDDVLKMWEGLGYYSRARNLHFTAKTILEKHNGVFPTEYNDILALKGIGPYTAAAIMSYAYNKKYAVVDGNVLRIVSRYLGIHEPVDQGNTHKQIHEWLSKQIDDKRPGDFNQAMMDLGATACTPKLYRCQECPLKLNCYAYKESLQMLLPIKSKSIVKKDRFFHYIIVSCNGKGIFVKRRESDIWKGLYDFPLIETTDNKELTVSDLKKWVKGFGKINFDAKNVKIVAMDKHILTHQNIFSYFYSIEIVDNTFELLKEYFIFVDRKNIANFAFPKIVNLYIEKHTDF